MRGSFAIGAVLFVVLLNPFSLLALALASGGFLVLVLMVLVPVAVLSSTHRDVMRDD